MNETPNPGLADVTMLNEVAAAARRAQETIAKLQAVTAALSESVLPADVAQVVVREMAAVLSADQAAVASSSPDGDHLILLQQSGLGAQTPEPLAVAFRTGNPIWIRSPPEYQGQLPDSRTAAMACAPLVASGTRLGVVGFGFFEAQNFDASQRALVEDLARQASLAFERARLYEVERAAAWRLEQASLARDEIMAVVSHDLRNPLASILLSTAAAMKLELADPKAPRVRKHLAMIRRSADRMTQLIGDLVDFDAVTTGQLTLERSRCDAAGVVQAATDMVAWLVEERSVQVETSSVAAVVLDGDRDRLVQAMANLLTNALKVTDPGGLVRAGAEVRGREVVFFVRDSGPGIAAEDLPRLFERYQRGRPSRYKATGLGLTIARGIVEAHGGRIWAESGAAAGSTFYFALPAASVEGRS
jgi:signal transduction histidine kinase